jgi:hypothetical protein
MYVYQCKQSQTSRGWNHIHEKLSQIKKKTIEYLILFSSEYGVNWNNPSHFYCSDQEVMGWYLPWLIAGGGEGWMEGGL